LDVDTAIGVAAAIDFERIGGPLHPRAAT